MLLGPAHLPWTVPWLLAMSSRPEASCHLVAGPGTPGPDPPTHEQMTPVLDPSSRALMASPVGRAAWSSLTTCCLTSTAVHLRPALVKFTDANACHDGHEAQVQIRLQAPLRPVSLPCELLPCTASQSA
ncbi:hypothetical protein HaLaN_12141 [Haematococcus lacustris]|uniref:Uncharacterized protein n=1 Tax=Haematococcus lacustris TaxID=44745 RepID=A0A699ZAF6_HAELA|nr:hypothetical protein HaLaN_12141 [Haematococcus lacustris]